MNIEKVMAVDPGRYDLSHEDIFDMLHEVGKDTARGIILAFRYGFMRGQTAEKNRAKTKAVKA